MKKTKNDSGSLSKVKKAKIGDFEKGGKHYKKLAPTPSFVKKEKFTKVSVATLEIGVKAMNELREITKADSNLYGAIENVRSLIDVNYFFELYYGDDTRSFDFNEIKSIELKDFLRQARKMQYEWIIVK